MGTPGGLLQPREERWGPGAPSEPGFLCPSPCAPSQLQDPAGAGAAAEPDERQPLTPMAVLEAPPWGMERPSDWKPRDVLTRQVEHQ